MLILLITAFAGIVLFEVPDLVRNRYWRELAAFSAFLLAGFILSLLQAMSIKMPDFNKVLIYVFKEVLHIYYP